MAGSMLDAAEPDRLPTAATCMNLLKLPPYRTMQVIMMRISVSSGGVEWGLDRRRPACDINRCCRH
jgi:hypothetical protein